MDLSFGTMALRLSHSIAGYTRRFQGRHDNSAYHTVRPDRHRTQLLLVALIRLGSDNGRGH